MDTEPEDDRTFQTPEALHEEQAKVRAGVVRGIGEIQPTASYWYY